VEEPELNPKRAAGTAILLWLGLVLTVLSLQARPDENEKLSAGGYFKNFSILLALPAYESEGTEINEPDLGAVNNRLRLKLDYRPFDFLSLDFAYDVSARIQDARLFEDDDSLFLLPPSEYRFSDSRQRLYPGPGDPVSSFGLFHNLDRLSLTLKTGRADLIVGRQAVAWGSARVINPTDVLAPFAFNELDQEDRRGIDAVRLRVSLGAMDELDMGFVAGRDFRSDRNAFFLRGKTYFQKTDVSAVLIAFREHLLLGLDIARAIGGAGFWLETAYVIPNQFRQDKVPEESGYFRASTGLDYTFNSKTYGFVEYHFNSAGESDPQKYNGLFGQTAYRDGSVYLLGKHYLNVGSTYQLTPLLSLTGLVILNLSDWSLVVSPTLEYNIAENIYLAAGAYLGWGKNPALAPDPLTSGPLLFRSEFGTYPDMFFTSFRVYF